MNAWLKPRDFMRVVSKRAHAIDPNETLKVFKEEFATTRKLDASLLRDYRTVQALGDRADNSTSQILLI